MLIAQQNIEAPKIKFRGLYSNNLNEEDVLLQIAYTLTCVRCQISRLNLLNNLEL